ncbi:uncharacterized protein VTP21DRAFT_2556 [Calcarisporiella thermophila]|uniref:uncharacterized protein n=1 Tax=Calcarisporiella thermophila TaxID=911321 RepID=UPI0037446B67
MSDGIASDRHKQIQHVGVRVEPKYFRDPTTRESISSLVHTVTSYAQNISRRLSTPHVPSFPHPNVSDPRLRHAPHPPFAVDEQHLQYTNFTTPSGEEIDSNGILCSKFAWLDRSRFCLLLGYNDGFQVWDASDPNNIHELVSVRDQQLGPVTWIGEMPEGVGSGLDDVEWEMGDSKNCKVISPLLALIAKPNILSSRLESRSLLHFYSLRLHKIIKTIEFGEEDEGGGEIVSCQCVRQVIVVATTTTLHFLSAPTLTRTIPILSDIAVSSNNELPAFALGSRWLAYASSSPIPSSRRSSSNAEAIGGDRAYDKVAKEVAKEVVQGVKAIGDYGYQTLSSLFSNSMPAMTSGGAGGMGIGGGAYYGGGRISAGSPVPPSPSFNSRRSASLSSPFPSPLNQVSGGGTGWYPNGPTGKSGKEGENAANETGIIMIRDLQAMQANTGNKGGSGGVIAHFKAHSNPICMLSFNLAGTLLASASTQGHTFHVFEISQRPLSGNAEVRHLYKLSRGYTLASVVDMHFSTDSLWLAVSTARGTTHMYAINPYGGASHVESHVKGHVVNGRNLYPWTVVERGEPVTMNPILRLRLRSQPFLEAKESVGEQQYHQQHSTQPSPQRYTPDGTPPYYDHYTFPPSLPSSYTGESAFESRRPGMSAYFVPPGMPQLTFSSPHIPSSPSSNSAHSPSGISLSAPTSSMSKQLSRAGSALKDLKRRSSSLTYMAVNQLVSAVSAGNNVSHYQSPYGASSNAVGGDIGSNVMSSHNKRASWASSGSDPEEAMMFAFEEEERKKKNHYSATKPETTQECTTQDVWTLHPAKGTLTLHRVWISATWREKRERGRHIMVPELVVGQEAIAEWGITRGADWDEVKVAIRTGEEKAGSGVNLNNVGTDDADVAMAQTKVSGKKQMANGRKPSSFRWLANAEIATHAITPYSPPFFTSSQFTCHVYMGEYEHELVAGRVPMTRIVDVKKGEVFFGSATGSNARQKLVQPLNSIKGSGRGGEGDGEDLAGNLSLAMRTKLEFDPSMASTPIIIGGSEGSSGHESLSFDDAFMIQGDEGGGFAKLATDEEFRIVFEQVGGGNTDAFLHPSAGDASRRKTLDDK